MGEDFLPETGCGLKLNWIEQRKIEYKFRKAECPSCKTRYHLNLGSMRLYLKVIGEEFFKHGACGEEISFVNVSHSVHDRRFGGGWGEVLYEDVPYCPKHEPEPNFHGKRVYYAPVSIKDGAIDAAASMAIVDENGKIITSE